LITHVCIIGHLESLSEDFEVKLDCLLLILLPFLGEHGIFAIIVRFTSENLQEQIFALLVLQCLLEVEWNLREGIKLLEPESPTLRQLLVLPELQR
jgi:hypothetical protein